MRFKDLIAFINKLWILLFFFLLITPNKSIAQPDTLELHRIWAIDLYEDITALRLADLDGDGTNEIFVGLWDGDSGYVEVFSGFNGIFIRRSEKLPAHKIIDLDVGDMDGDQEAEVVVLADTIEGYRFNSLTCVLDAAGLSLDWQERIEGKVQSIEVEDMDQNDTAEAYIGTVHQTEAHSESMHDPNDWIWERWYGGVLYHLNGKDKVLTRITGGSNYVWGGGYWKLISDDVDQDSFQEVVCGTFYAYLVYTGYGGSSHVRTAALGLIRKDMSLSELNRRLYDDWEDTEFSETYAPNFRSIAIGNLDSDENKEIATFLDCGEEWWGHHLILSICDGYSGVVQESISYPGNAFALGIYDVTDQPPDEILIAHSNGLIQALDGATLDTIAISDPLPPISFFAFEDVTGDALPEVCISDGDSLFVYTTPVTGAGEEDEENLASKFVLHQNYPNPFNAKTTIRYYLPQSSRVELSIYNIMGQKVKTLVNDFQLAGFQNIAWDGTDKNGSGVASGVYFYRVKTDCSEETKKMVLLK